MGSSAMHRTVADELGKQIVAGTVEPGTVISLADLEERYSVSRTVAREVMRRLEILGLIKVRRRIGLVVNTPEGWDVMNPRVIRWRLDGPGRDDQLRSLLDLRIAMEPVAARLAATHASDEDAQLLLDTAHKIRELGEQGLGQTDEYLMTDVSYHTTLLRVSGNEMLAALHGVVEAVMAGRTRLGFSPEVPDREVVRLHEVTARAIQQRMPEAAEIYCRYLVTGVRAELFH